MRPTLKHLDLCPQSFPQVLTAVDGAAEARVLVVLQTVWLLLILIAVLLRRLLMSLLLFLFLPLCHTS